MIKATDILEIANEQLILDTFKVKKVATGIYKTIGYDYGVEEPKFTGTAVDTATWLNGYFGFSDKEEVRNREGIIRYAVHKYTNGNIDDIEEALIFSLEEHDTEDMSKENYNALLQEVTVKCLQWKDGKDARN
ncbi:hypothetical protein [Bacillus phage BC-T25]|nr:hypothetical protein [Bacillus phage BC-T25]